MPARTATFRAVVLGFLLVFALAAPRAIAQDCQPGWAEGQFNLPGVDGTIHAMAMFDDGSGEALYIGGDFVVAGPVASRGLARWDGQRWSAVTSTPGEPYAGRIGGSISAMAVYDDGSGPALYVGGSFNSADGLPARNIARWDGRAWEALGEGADGLVAALAVHDDGTGPALYVGGNFHSVGDISVSKLARWDAAGWSVPPGLPATGGVRALAVHDDGTGPALYAADQTYLDSVPAERVSRLDGDEWTSLGDTRLGGWITSLASHDDGGGPALYVGGWFAELGGQVAQNLARWDGSGWSAVGGGVGDDDRERVIALVVHDDGDGPDLYAGGIFVSAGGQPINDVARWDGHAWSAVGEGEGRFPVNALASVDLGLGPVLAAGGRQGVRGELAISGLGLWDGQAWSVPDEGASMGLRGETLALTVYDDGSGPQLVAGGRFERGGLVAASRVARWDGQRWHPLGEYPGDERTIVNALAVFDDGSGPALYAGGGPVYGYSDPGEHIARWNGSAWVPLGEGLNGTVSDMAVYDDGDGPDLYVAGGFTQAGGRLAKHIARWDGSAWSTVGVGRGEGFDRAVSALEVYDDGTGPALYAGGSFRVAGGTASGRLARWDGVAWSPVKEGPGADDDVLALETYDLSEGPRLFAAGDFLNIDGTPANRVAQWDGSEWTPLGVGVLRDVNALVGFDDGTGPALYAAGDFFRLGDERRAYYIARWDGTDWSPLDTGLDDHAEALAVHDDGSGQALYVGGVFSAAGGVASTGIARWDGCDPCRADLDGDGALTVFDFIAFINLYNTGDLAADFDGDGELTVLDFLAFQNAFDAGC
ncbi:MAG: GC-type dockerin domain-anchored protein [Phycisphaerales bacterium JB060]